MQTITNQDVVLEKYDPHQFSLASKISPPVNGGGDMTHA